MSKYKAKEKKNDLKVNIEYDAMIKIRTMVMSCKKEVGALLRCDLDTDTKTVTVKDIIIPKQVVTASSTEFDEDDVDEIIFEAMKDGWSEEIMGWVHSHADMTVFWSSVDVPTIEKLREHIGGVCISIVANHAGDMLTRVDYHVNSPFGGEYTSIDKIETSVVGEPYVSEIADIIKMKVSERVYPVNWGSYAKGSTFHATTARKGVKEFLDEMEHPEKATIYEKMRFLKEEGYNVTNWTKHKIDERYQDIYDQEMDIAYNIAYDAYDGGYVLEEYDVVDDETNSNEKTMEYMAQRLLADGIDTRKYTKSEIEEIYDSFYGCGVYGK